MPGTNWEKFHERLFDYWSWSVAAGLVGVGAYLIIDAL